VTAASKTAIVTGANSGLGLACVGALLQRDPAWYVVLAVRDADRGHAAIQRLGQPTRCTAIALDLASLASVRSFTAEHRERALPPTRALICNAGVQVISDTRLTSDGFEVTFGVNHLGHFALVQGVLEQLAAPARVVVVSSDTHDSDKHTGMPAPRYDSAETLAHPAAGQVPAGRERYTTSKLCNVLFAYELDRRLGHGQQGVTVNAFNPGLMPGSGLARDYGPVERFAWRFLMPAMRILPGVRSTRQSGRHLAALVSDPGYENVTGSYFDGLKAVSSSADSYDRAKALDLWQTSERLITSAGANS
jgi:light-dependent protochlorophyllide reductase